MAQAKGGNGTVIADDLIGDIVDDVAPVRKNAARTADFTVNDALLDRIKASLSRTGALSITRLFPTAKDARNGTRIYAQHCDIAVQDFEGKSIRTAIVEIDDDFIATHDWAKGAKGQFAVSFALTHKRNRKPKDEEATAETTAETPAETPATA